jgi:NAD(P) transhydrogenase subunit alpha
VIGALVIAGSAGGALRTWLGFAAVILATINIVGGFVVTDRMLQMFKRKPEDRPPPPGR